MCRQSSEIFFRISLATPVVLFHTKLLAAASNSEESNFPLRVIYTHASTEVCITVEMGGGGEGRSINADL